MSFCSEEAEKEGIISIPGAVGYLFARFVILQLHYCGFALALERDCFSARWTLNPELGCSKVTSLCYWSIPNHLTFP